MYYGFVLCLLEQMLAMYLSMQDVVYILASAGPFIKYDSTYISSYLMNAQRMV